MTNIETAIGFLKEQVRKMQTEEKIAPENVCVAMVTYTQSCTLEVIEVSCSQTRQLVSILAGLLSSFSPTGC